MSAVNVIPENCSICYESIDSSRQLPCTHKFHEVCINTWLENHNSCPLCRREVVPVQPQPAAQQMQGFSMEDVIHGQNQALDLLLGQFDPGRDFINDEIRDRFIQNASLCGRIEYLPLLLNMRSETISDAARGKGAIHAAALGRFDCLQLLLESGPIPRDVGVRVADFSRAAAARNGVEVPQDIHALLEAYNAPVASRQSQFSTALMSVAVAALAVMGAWLYTTS